MKRSSGFTLIELVIVMAIAGALIALSVTGALRFKGSVEYKYSVDQVFSDIKLTQQLADTSSQPCRIEFRAGHNEYSIYRNGSVYRSSKINPRFRFYGKSFFSFVGSGYTDVGGSGTLMIEGPSRTKKIIVSSKGRIRIE